MARGAASLCGGGVLGGGLFRFQASTLPIKFPWVTHQLGMRMTVMNEDRGGIRIRGSDRQSTGSAVFSEDGVLREFKAPMEPPTGGPLTSYFGECCELRSPSMQISSINSVSTTRNCFSVTVHGLV